MAIDTKKNKEPLFHIVKRANMSVLKRLLIYAVAIAVGFLITGLFCSVANSNDKGLSDMLKSVFVRSFDTKSERWRFLRDTALLLCVSFAIVPAFKMKFWNLGGNGQILIGCLACYACMYYGNKYELSKGLVNFLMVVSSVCMGIIWAVIPAIFKAFFKTNESLFTLMMNYIAVGLVSVFITVWFPKGSGSVKRIKNYGLPELINPYMLTIIVVAVVAIIITLYLKKSKVGFETSLVGESENTAKYVGINVKKVVIRTLIISGAICGLVGLLLSGSINYTVSEDMSNNMGFTAIMTVWLAKFNPYVMILTCLLINFISNGMRQVKMDFGFYNNAIASVVLGVIYFFIIGCEFFINYKIVFRKGLFTANKKEIVDGNEKEVA